MTAGSTFLPIEEETKDKTEEKTKNETKGGKEEMVMPLNNITNLKVETDKQPALDETEMHTFLHVLS